MAKMLSTGRCTTGVTECMYWFQKKIIIILQKLLLSELNTWKNNSLFLGTTFEILLFFFFWCISFNSGHIWSFSKLSCAWNDIRNGVRMCSSKAIIQTKTSLSFTLWHFLRVLLKYFLIPWYHSFAHLHFLYMNKCFLWCLKGFTSGINIQEGLTKHIPPSQ